MEQRWDVIVVGARCAGATLAALLARAGVRTLLLEAAPRGTDQPMSTHLMQPPGMGVLDRLGLGERVRAVVPATRRFRLALDASELIAPMPEERPAYCVRRSTLDPLLQLAAESSGAEFRDQQRVVELIQESGRVAGVVVQGRSGRERLHAGLVVGADGVHSTIARMTGVEEYLTEEGSRAGYWAYYPAPERWTESWDATLEHRGDELRYVFRCDGDAVVLVYVGAAGAVRAWGSEYRERLTQALNASPTTAAFARGKAPTGKTIGLLKTRFFYRRPVGPGFALVGDAGHFKDFVTGQGMADALLDAERLSEAIVDGRPAAFEQYWRARDVDTLPVHFDALRQGRVGYNNPFMRWTIAQLGQRPDLLARVALVFDRKLPPDAMIPQRALFGFVGKALVRGKLDVVKGFLHTGKQMAAEQKEFVQRCTLLDAARQQLAESAPATEQRARMPMSEQENIAVFS